MLITSDIKPKLVIIGQSMITFATSLDRIANACREAGSARVYNGSHVLGLIAGGLFQIHCGGANVLLWSTHKSFLGPQGGIILSDMEHSTVSEYLPLRVIDNPHFNRIAALILAMEEMHSMEDSMQDR